MLEKNKANFKFLEAVVDIATTAEFLVSTGAIKLEDSRLLPWAVVEIAEAFQESLGDFDYDDPDQEFRCYIEEIDDFAEKELIKRFPSEEPAKTLLDR